MAATARALSTALIILPLLLLSQLAAALPTPRTPVTYTTVTVSPGILDPC